MNNLHFVHSPRSFCLVNVAHTAFVTAFLKKVQNLVSFGRFNEKAFWPSWPSLSAEVSSSRDSGAAASVPTAPCWASFLFSPLSPYAATNQNAAAASSVRSTAPRAFPYISKNASACPSAWAAWNACPPVPKRTVWAWNSATGLIPAAAFPGGAWPRARSAFFCFSTSGPEPRDTGKPPSPGKWCACFIRASGRSAIISRNAEYFPGPYGHAP